MPQLNCLARHVPTLTLCLSIAVLCGSASAQPANDNCTDAASITGFSLVAWDTAGATTDGTPNASCLIGGGDGQAYNDVWFAWTAAANGPVTIATCGTTTMDTRIVVYPGGICPAVAPIVCNDDTCGLQSGVGFNATSGATYLIRLGSATGAETGAGMLSVASGMVAGPIAALDGQSEYYLTYASTWNEGETIAQGLGGHLATITDDAENLFVRESVLSFDAQPRRAWLGLHSPAQDGVFTWVSGDPSAYRAWITGEPNNLEGREYSVEMVNELEFAGRWNDAPFDHLPTRFAIVEVPTQTTCPADLDNDGNFDNGGSPDNAVTIDDLLYFLIGFEQGSPLVDVDNDGDPAQGVPDDAVTIDDLLFFLIRFEQGC